MGRVHALIARTARLNEENLTSDGCVPVLLLAYAFGFSPNQTPYKDIIFIKLLTGISQDSTFSVNPVYFSVFNIIGLYTFFYQSLLIPGGEKC